MADRVLISIGTKKGVFVADGSVRRQKFSLQGPYGQGVAVYSTLIDTRRASPRVFASSCNAFFGMKLLMSSNLGKTFKETKSPPAFPKADGRELENIWSLEPGADKRELWCGVQPAALFHSGDGGDSWELVEGISNHEHAPHWHPGQGGLCLHTIVRRGDRMHVAISAGGHYISDDNGQHFQAANDGVGAGFVPDPYPEFGQCVHKIACHPDTPHRLYMQNHGGWAEWHGPGGPRPNIGVLRSDDYGQTWTSIAEGLPSDFGFPILVHPQNPDVVYVMPLDPMTRVCPQGAPAVYRSQNAGKSWRRLSKGLPKKDSYFTVLRDAMSIDESKSPAVYFGTTTGQLWIGRDGGEQWDCLFDSLPPINCVKVAIV
ncbi:MAG: exo-alpha-sialidase [bacterium]|nr:exo-alpha-sialidase [bacterium]